MMKGGSFTDTAEKSNHKNFLFQVRQGYYLLCNTGIRYACRTRLGRVILIQLI